MRYFHLFTILLLSTLATPVVSAQLKTTEITPAISVVIQFKQPMKNKQFVKWVESFKGEILELRHSHKDMIGVYTPPIGMDPQNVFEAMLQKHEEFLNEANSLTADDLATASDKNAHDRLYRLKAGFESAIQEIESGDFGIVLVRINVDKLSALDNDTSILRTTQTQMLSKKEVVLTRRIAEVDLKPKLLKSASYSHESWAPYYGTTKTTQYLAWNTFYFNDVSYYGGWESYEHETQIYDGNFADYDDYWSTNLPTAYKDSQVCDNPNSDNFAIGTLTPTALSTYVRYYTYMSLRPGTTSSSSVKIQAQIGFKSYPQCVSYGSWCVLYPLATTVPPITTYTAPIYYNQGWNY